MSDVDILHEMIRDAAKVEVRNLSNRKQVELREAQYASSSATISGLPDNVIVIKADAFVSPDKVFKGSRGECKRSDYVIIAEAANKKVILCIEMKANKGHQDEIVRQLYGTQCFVSYCQKVGQTFWRERSFLKGYQYRYISIAHTSIAKRATRIRRERLVHDSPERMLKIDWPHHLEFNHLAGAR